MSRSGNKIWLLSLMIISQVMLTGLLIQWLRSQWRDEKEALQKDINQKFIECANQVIDSMLIKHLIDPVLKDSSVSGPYSIKFNKEILPEKTLPDQHITAYYNQVFGRNHRMVTVSLDDSDKTEHKADYSLSSSDSNEKKMLLRSVKLIIRQAGDSTGGWTQLNHMVSAVPDTNYLKSLFRSKLGKEGAEFKIIWFSDSIKKKSDANDSKLFFSSSLFEKPFKVEITGLQKDIFRGISAQILFAIVLLLSTSAAFLLTYRNLKKQELLNTLRNDFVSNISHELKTPVSTVSIALEALKNFNLVKDPSKANDYLNIATSEMKRLDLLISQVLNTSILEDNGGYIKMDETDLIDLTRDVLNSMQVRFEQTGANVDFLFDKKFIPLMLDKLHLKGVLINILDNSLKYRSINPEIKISIEDKASSVILTIGDNGPGIPKEYISKVFDKFFRVPKGEVHNIKGYGLGLNFADLVMKQHEGSISVRNKIEGGCEFTLTFRKHNK